MPSFRPLKRAPYRAPFLHFTTVASLIVYFLLFLSASAMAGECVSDRFDASVSADFIYDGDTLRLKDGRKLRIIGINTPERAHDTQPAEPYAEAARQRLMALLAPQPRLKLRYDQQRQDRYGRLLAHAFLTDGRNLSRILLSEGLGAAITVPPNLWHQPCYFEAEQQARSQSRGIWQHAYFQPLDATRIPPKTRGFRFVSGRISHIGKSRSSIWLNLGPDFALQIKKTNLKYFKQLNIRQLRNRQIVARGWIYAYKRQLRMQLPHPAALQVQQ